MNTMSYRGYSARVEFDADDRIFVGHLAGVRDIVGFHGKSVSELERAFREAVDDYLAACEKLGQSPDKPFSGRVMLRLPPECACTRQRACRGRGRELQPVGGTRAGARDAALRG